MTHTIQLKKDLWLSVIFWKWLHVCQRTRKYTTFSIRPMCVNMNMPVSGVMSKLILNTVFDVGNFTCILAMWLRSGADAFVVPIVSHYPSLSSSGVWVLGREPQPRCGGEDGTKTTTAHRLPSDGEGKRWHSSFGGLGLIASPCEGLKCPYWECGPSYTHALRHREA